MNQRDFKEGLKEGEIVQFEFERYAHQSYPVNPSFVKIRNDVAWEDVIQNNGIIIIMMIN